jgi:hypothetical protein
MLGRIAPFVGLGLVAGACILDSSGLVGVGSGGHGGGAQSSGPSTGGTGLAHASAVGPGGTGGTTSSATSVGGGGSGGAPDDTWTRRRQLTIELGGNATIANPVVGGMPYIDFHFGRVVGGVTVAEDFNARLINRADGILDVQTSTGGAAAETRLSIGNNIGVGTTTPQTPSPTGTTTTGNLDANDVYLRSTSQWLSQAGGVRVVHCECQQRWASRAAGRQHLLAQRCPVYRPPRSGLGDRYC